MFIRLQMISLAVAVGFTGPALAGDAYYSIPIQELKLVEGRLPEVKQVNWQHLERMQSMLPYAAVDGQGEAYVALQARGFAITNNSGAFPVLEESSPPTPTAVAPGPNNVASLDIVPITIWNGQSMRQAYLYLRAQQGKDITGRLVVPNSKMTGMVSLAFSVPATAAKPEAKAAFYQAKAACYEHLLGRDIPGGAWFRHQVRLTRAEQNLPPAGEVVRPPRWPGRTGELSETYDLFTGGRAMSENLQLDRALPPARPNETPGEDRFAHRDHDQRDRLEAADQRRPAEARSAGRARFPPTSTWSSFPVFRRRRPWPTRPTGTTRPCCG